MAYHNKAKNFAVAQYGSHEERMNKLMHKIKRTPENRNTRRQNRRLAQSPECYSAHRLQ